DDLAGLEIRIDRCAAGDGHFLASSAFQTILVEVISTETTGAPADWFGDPQADPHHGGRESYVGCAVHGALKKLGYRISERTASRWMPRKIGKPSQTWMTFLRNHVGQMVSVDFFTVPTIQLRVLYVFFILAHDRRRVVHFNVTEHPTADWTAHQ